jgi:predicted AAA+ superfamily ATPase
MFIPRLLTAVLRSLAEAPIGRGLIVTGARQTGKTTLLQREFVPPYEYHSFDEVLTRESLARRPAADWMRHGADYVFDEVQKAPDFLGTVKSILDDGRSAQRAILSGSAQIQLLSAVRESLAGRVVTCELFPLTAAEIAGVARPLVLDLLASRTREDVRTLVEEAAFLGAEATAPARASLEHITAFGGMPRIMQLETPEHRWIWLGEYCQSYLQRDLADLGRVSDLDDFVRLGRIAAQRTATSLNYSDLARDVDLSPVTAKKYLRYLDLSYQTFLLDAFRGRSGGRLLKAPRLHWVDLGVQRTLSRLREGLTGPQFESLIVGEIHKLVKTLRLDVELSYLRTKDGREVDLLTRLPNGSYLAWEAKASQRAHSMDARHLRTLSDHLDGPLLAGFVVHCGHDVEAWDGELYAIPASALFTGRSARSGEP